MAKYRVRNSNVGIDARNDSEWIPGDRVQDIVNLQGRYVNTLSTRPGHKRWNSTELPLTYCYNNGSLEPYGGRQLLQYSGGSYSFLTDNINYGNTVTLFDSAPVSGDAIYIGDSTHFNNVSFNITGVYTSGVNIPIVIEYYNGTSWESLTTYDSYTNLSEISTGTFTIPFNTPSDWDRIIFPTSGTNRYYLYWIRIRVSSVVSTTSGFIVADSISLNRVNGGIQGQYRFSRADGNIYNIGVCGGSLYVDSDNSGRYYPLVRYRRNMYLGKSSSMYWIMGDKVTPDYVYEFKNSVFTDITSNMVNGVTTVLSTTSDTYFELYIGSDNTFNAVEINIVSNASTPLSFTKTYYNGSSWVSLTTGYDDITDTSDYPGKTYLIYTEPTNFTKVTVNSVNAYWVRIVASSGTQVGTFSIDSVRVYNTSNLSPSSNMSQGDLYSFYADSVQASGTSTGITSTTLTDSSANWVTDEFKGMRLNPNTGRDNSFVIVSNTSTTITVSSGDLTTVCDVGYSYCVYIPNSVRQFIPIATVSDTYLTGTLVDSVTSSSLRLPPVQQVDILENNTPSTDNRLIPDFTVINNRVIVSGISIRPKVTDGIHVRQLGYTPPSSVSVSATTGSLDGVYKWAVTYVYRTSMTEGGESNPVYSDRLSLSGEGCVITLPSDYDQWVEGFRIYRTKDLTNPANSSSTLYLLKEILNTNYTTYTDSTSDDDLQGIVLETDHDLPPDNLIITEEWGGKLYGIRRFEHKLYYSEPSEPNIFKPASYENIGVGDEGTGLTKYFGPLIYFTKRNRYTIFNRGGVLSWRESNDNIGLWAPYTLVESPYGIIFLSYDSIYLWDGVNIPRDIGYLLERVFRGESNGTGIIANRGILHYAVASYYRDGYYISIPTSDVNDVEFKCELNNKFRWVRNTRGFTSYLREHHLRDTDLLLAGSSTSGIVYQVEGDGLCYEDDTPYDNTIDSSYYTGPIKVSIPVSIKTKSYNFYGEQKYISYNIRPGIKYGDLTVDWSIDFDQDVGSSVVKLTDFSKFELGTSTLGTKVSSPSRGLSPDYLVNFSEKATGKYLTLSISYNDKYLTSIREQSLDVLSTRVGEEPLANVEVE